MQIRVEQLNPTIGDIKNNTNLILEAYRKAEEDGISLLILPELGVCGYPPMDLLEREAFIDKVGQAVEKIISCTSETALIFGAPTRNRKATGRKLFNAAIMAQNGEQVDEVHKALLPTYDVFDEFRYFEPNDDIRPVEWDGMKLGLTICEDIWYNENAIQYHIYEDNPIDNLVSDGADVIINISASPFTKSKPQNRWAMLAGHAREYGIPVLYANQVGGNTELIFDGDSMALDEKGESVDRAPLFEVSGFDVEWNKASKSLKPVGNGRKARAQEKSYDPIESKEARIFEALRLGLRDYLGKSGVSDRIVLGLSGGIDSALATVIAAEAIGPDKVLAVTMPSEYSSAGSVTDSGDLARNLGIRLEEIPIKGIYNSFLGALDSLFEGTEFGVAEENLQSRSRGNLLMAISNKFGHMLINTGNKSEMAVGYATLYGDMAGGLSVISDLYKMEVYAVARWLNEVYYEREVVPESILQKAPSAELRPDQKDSDSLPDYDVMDGILEAYIENQWSRKKLIDSGYDPAVVDRVLKLVDLNEYKRRQAPPGLKVSEKAFGIGRRFPIVQAWTGHEQDEIV